MKKILLSTAVVALFAFYTNAQEKLWNFSDAQWEVKSYTAQTVIDGLSINPSSSGAIDIDANSKSIDGYSFTKRLKLGGSGSPVADGRNVSFEVTGTCKITVYGMASSSSAMDRSIIISDGTNELYKQLMPGDAINKHEYDYTGGAATLYFYSSSSGLNFYAIKAEGPGVSNAVVKIDEKPVKSIDYYDITGRKLTDISNLRRVLIISRTTYTDGTYTCKKFIQR